MAVMWTDIFLLDGIAVDHDNDEAIEDTLDSKETLHTT